ncbi:phosphonopyruvate decarboxylase [Candidatus Kaiserbacteria bacterium]|nr:phosphonopyruvate decarboxylase [Candidatus Kaiserbacteria bacterium]
MVHPEKFIESLRRNGISFFSGVPDSLLKDLLAYIEQNVPAYERITAANEGNAIAIAAGYHLATGKVAAVYMQNSGIGNAVNPLTSLADKDVYAIPMLLIIGWRGEPGVKDEPQHKKQGRISDKLLDVLEIPHAVLSKTMSGEAIASEVARLAALSRTEGRPCALLVKSGTFEAYPMRKPVAEAGSLGREEAIGLVLDSLDGGEIVVSTTGKISRELYEERKNRGESFGKDFLTVGSMGHASQIALGIAHQKKDRQVYCLDGDGATIMHMGGLATAGWMHPKNFKHIVLNNLAHESVGGQPSAASIVDLPGVAKNCGYAFASTAATKEDLPPRLAELKEKNGPAFLEIRVNLESRKDLGRPKESPFENKKKFMDFIGK